jgi:integrase
MGTTSIFSVPKKQVTTGKLVGLSAATGIRVGEAISLDVSDIDRGRQLLLVRDSKLGIIREVLLHPTGIAALGEYCAHRAPRQPRSHCPAVFLSLAGIRQLYCNVHNAFLRMVTEAKLPARSGTSRPRIHDLQHSFAVASMLDAYTADADGQAQLASVRVRGPVLKRVPCRLAVVFHRPPDARKGCQQSHHRRPP